MNILPKDVPPSTVKGDFDEWREMGVWRTISNELVVQARNLEGRRSRSIGGG
jgi:hypothetical protein